jgi:hypothetical protein
VVVVVVVVDREQNKAERVRSDWAAARIIEKTELIYLGVVRFLFIYGLGH